MNGSDGREGLFGQDGGSRVDAEDSGFLDRVDGDATTCDDEDGRYDGRRDQSQLPLCSDGNNEGAGKHGKRLDDEDQFLGNARLDPVPVGGDLGSRRADALAVEMPNLLTKGRFEEFLSQTAGSPRRRNVNGGRGDVCGSESAKEEVDEPKDEMVDIVAELIGAGSP